jgi:hypothetical protein
MIKNTDTGSAFDNLNPRRSKMNDAIGAISVCATRSGHVRLSGKLRDVMQLTETHKIPIKLHHFGTTRKHLQMFKAAPAKYQHSLADVVVAD